MEAVTATVELETYLLTISNFSTGGNDTGSNADTPATQKHVNVLDIDGQPNLMEMLVKFADKLECLEQKSSERQHDGSNTIQNREGKKGPSKSFVMFASNQDIMPVSVLL